MLLKCERCGAPLEVPAGGAVRCPYCGTTASAPAPAPAASPAHGVGYFPTQPGAGHPPRGQAPVPSAVRGRSTWVWFLVPVLLSVGAGVVPRLLQSTDAPALQQALSKVTSGSRVPTLSAISWGGGDPGCLIDANGDGVFDIAGLTGAMENNQATVVDGKTGELLFTAPAVKKAEQLACLGDNGFFLLEGNFQLDFFTARSPWGKTAVMAKDKVSAYGAGQGCVQIRTDDGTTQGIALPSGVATTCPATVRRYHDDQPGLMGLTDHGTELTVGARKYVMTTRASGTEILTVRVKEGAREVWSRELPYASCTFGAGIAVVAGKIVLWAAEPAERDKGLIVGLDEATGNQLYEIPVTDSVTNNPRLFLSNGKYVVAVSWGALRAYDPATGAEAWRVGR